VSSQNEIANHTSRYSKQVLPKKTLLTEPAPQSAIPLVAEILLSHLFLNPKTHPTTGVKKQNSSFQTRAPINLTNKLPFTRYIWAKGAQLNDPHIPAFAELPRFCHYRL